MNEAQVEHLRFLLLLTIFVTEWTWPLEPWEVNA